MAPLQSSVTADRLFAPAPHGLINDPLISHAAFRLWCVLHRLAWLREEPTIGRMAEEMTQDDRTPDRRSVYRWLGELEGGGWLDWTRTPGKASVNRFVVRSERKSVTPESQPVTPESQPVTPESQPVTPESQPVTLRSQVPPICPLPEQAKRGPKNRENHEIDDGGGRTLAFLIDQGVGSAREFQHIPYDAVAPDYLARVAAGQTNAMIVNAWRRKPPEIGCPYERPASNGHAPDVADRRKPSERIGDRPALPPGLRLAGRKTPADDAG
jgi:hypothetical protein